jgi:Transcriptional regulatory protein, C terminal
MSALAVADATTVTRPASVRPAYLGRARARLRPVTDAAATPDPVTVTISIDGGSAAGRDRVLAALRELVEAAGPDATVALAPALRPAPAAGSISLDPRPRTVVRDGWPLHLSRLEYDLLLFLARHPQQVFSRTQLLAQVWGHTHTTARTVDVHISRLRTKLGDQELITTVYGLGYRLADEAAVSVAGE